MGEKKVIWITGASSGIGKAVAIKFAENGWTVAASARRENLLNELKTINENIYPFPLDVTDINKLKFFLEKGVSNNTQWKLWSRNGIEGVNRHFSWNTHVRNYLSILKEECLRPNTDSSSCIKQSCLKGSSSLIKPHSSNTSGSV